MLGDYTVKRGNMMRRRRRELVRRRSTAPTGGAHETDHLFSHKKKTPHFCHRLANVTQDPMMPNIKNKQINIHINK